MLSYPPSCCISSPMQSATLSLLSSQDHCHHQETASSSITSSPTVSQPRQNGFQDELQPIRLASMSITTTTSSSSPSLPPPPLMIPTTADESNTITNTSSTTNDYSHYHHHHHHHHHQQQQQYQHRHASSSSSSSSPSWSLGYPPVTPPSNQQDVLMMDQSPLYDPYPSQQQQQQQQSSYHAHFRQTPMIAHPTTATVMEPMFNHRGSTSSLSLMSPQLQHPPHYQPPLKKHLRFHIVLQATTAVTQKTEHSSLTYLNRGQSYGIQLADKLGHDGLIQSQFVIMFHDPSHRKIALNYWKFWIGQQKDPQHARAVDLDPHQSIGIMNVRYPSFDRIAFDWHGRHGAKLFVRFHCLSTDFSRIKGVKGIPLRACMSSQISTNANDPLLQRHYAGSIYPPSSNENKDSTDLDYLEQSYCKVKLFRDKGAERKNKDDAKQLGKQFEKMIHEGDPRQHPMWLMYNESVPYSIFSETPTSPTLESFDHAMLTPASNNNNTTTIAASSLSTLTHPRPKQFTPKLSSSLPTLSYHYQQQQQQQQQSSSSTPYQYKHHYHPYAKRPPPPNTTTTTANASTTTTTTTVPTQLYSSSSSNGYESLLPSTSSPLIASSSSTSSSSSPPLPSFVSNSNSHSSTTTTTGTDNNDSTTSPSYCLPITATSSSSTSIKQHMPSLQEQQQLYQQAYPYQHQHQHQHQQQHQHEHHDRFSPIPSTENSILTAWRRS